LTTEHTEGRTAPLGIIDTISEGFRLVTRRAWLILVPVGLDLFLWLGPKLSIAPVVEKTLQLLSEAMRKLAASGAGQADLEFYDMLAQLMREGIGRVNLLGLLAWGSLGVSSVAGGQPIDANMAHVLQVTTYWQLILWQIGLLGMGLLIACLFLCLLARQVRGSGEGLGSLVGDVAQSWVRLLVIFLPLGMLVTGAVLGSFIFGPLSILLGAGLLWLAIFLAFAPQAVTLSRLGPLQAIANSFRIVRANLWSVIGLLLLANLLNMGLGLIWQRLARSSDVGMLAAIVASAYVSTALTAAMFVFYRDRELLLAVL